MRHRFVALVVAGLLVLLAAPTAAAAECEFVLGFKTLKTLIDAAEGPDKVGACLENDGLPRSRVRRCSRPPGASWFGASS